MRIKNGYFRGEKPSFFPEAKYETLGGNILRGENWEH
jgi:hypothetical protein